MVVGADDTASSARPLRATARRSDALVRNNVAACRRSRAGTRPGSSSASGFAWLDEIGSLAAHAGEFSLALWFHDAIYDPRRQDNERKSADWAKRSLLANGGSPQAADRIHALVMATRHAVPRGRDEEILVDIDLSILGAAPARANLARSLERLR